MNEETDWKCPHCDGWIAGDVLDKEKHVANCVMREATMSEKTEQLILPDCMMPDGGDCCLGYQQLYAKERALQAENEKLFTDNGELWVVLTNITELVEKSNFKRTGQLLDEADRRIHNRDSWLEKLKKERDELKAENELLREQLAND